MVGVALVDWAGVRSSLLPVAHREGGDDGEDLLHDAIERYLLKIRDGREIAHPVSYMWTCIRNGALNNRRKNWRLVPLSVHARADPCDDVDERLDDARAIEGIKAAGGDPLIEYYQWWYTPTPADRVWAHRLRQKLKGAIRL